MHPIALQALGLTVDMLTTGGAVVDRIELVVFTRALTLHTLISHPRFTFLGGHGVNA
jgi:hypothetical protein